MLQNAALLLPGWLRSGTLQSALLPPATPALGVKFVKAGFCLFF